MRIRRRLKRSSSRAASPKLNRTFSAANYANYAKWARQEAFDAPIWRNSRNSRLVPIPLLFQQRLERLHHRTRDNTVALAVWVDKVPHGQVRLARNAFVEKRYEREAVFFLAS